MCGDVTWNEDDNSLKSMRPHSFVCGSGTVADGRQVLVGGDDFTHRAGHSEGSATLLMGLFRKQSECEARSRVLRKPMVRLLDGSSGGGSVATVLELGYNYVPPLLGFEHKVKMLAEVPVATALLGPVVGFGAARAVTSHYSVMCSKVSSLFVAGPPVVAALGEQVTKEELGGAQVHGANGSVDDVVGSETEAIECIHRFLSFLPSSAWELPPVIPTTDSPDRREVALDSLIPRHRRAVFDIRQLVCLVVDNDTPFFEMGKVSGRRVGRELHLWSVAARLERDGTKYIDRPHGPQGAVTGSAPLCSTAAGRCGRAARTDASALSKSFENYSGNRVGADR